MQGVPTLYKNPHAWTNIASMLFWEAPQVQNPSFLNTNFTVFNAKSDTTGRDQ